MGIDYGSKRIGLAVSDETGSLAFPAGALARTNRRKDLEALAEFVKDRDVEQIAIGLPLHMSGEMGPEAKAVLAFADELRDLTGLPVDSVDERWTTREAERVRGPERGKKRRRVKSGELDAAAATLILRTWLERKTASGPSELQ